MQLLARWLGNPIVFLIAAAAVAADVAYWRLAVAGHTSLLGGESVLRSRTVRAVVRWPCTALVEGPGGELSLRPRGSPSAYPGTLLLEDESHLPPGARLVAHLRCPVVTTTAGLAAPVLEVTPYALVIEPADLSGVTARHEVAGRYLFARYLERWMRARGDWERAHVLPSLLARGDGVVYGVRARGLVHDGVVLACLGAGAASIGLCPWWVKRRVRGAPTDRCAGCGYDLRGLPGDVCPECGRAAAPLRRVPRGRAGGRTPS